jgi:hypothetical protein
LTGIAPHWLIARDGNMVARTPARIQPYGPGFNSLSSGLHCRIKITAFCPGHFCQRGVRDLVRQFHKGAEAIQLGSKPPAMV